MDKKVAIVAKGKEWVNTPFTDDNFELWSFNECYEKFGEHTKYFDRWFEMNQLNTSVKLNEIHQNWLKNAQIPIYMLHQHDDIPQSISYPLSEVTKHFNNYYFTCTVSYIIALAILEGFKEIHIIGINMLVDEEYMIQMPSVEFWLGVAIGRGIKVVTQYSNLLKTPALYGYQANNSMCVEIKKHRTEIKQTIAQNLKDTLKLLNKLETYNYKFFQEYNEKSKGESKNG